MTESESDLYRLVAEARNPDRLFSVRTTKENGFYAGHLPDGTQVLVGRTRAEKILLLFFTTSGWLYDIQRRQLPQIRTAPETPYLDVNDAEFHEYLLEQFRFTPRLVRVVGFLVTDDESGFWVGPLPGHFDQFLDAPGKYSAEERSEYPEMIRSFILRGGHVVDWGNDWRILNADGIEVG
jgi:hypothetical protein